MFLTKLKQVSITISMTLDKKQYFINTMARLSLLMIVVLISSTLCLFGLVTAAIFPNDWWSAILGMMVSSLDMVTNGLCLYLQWPFATIIYKKICKICNNFMIKKCKDAVDSDIGIPDTVPMDSKARSTTISDI